MQRFVQWLYKASKDQKGAINIAGLMMMGIAMIFLAVGFIIYPIILDATDDILAWDTTLTCNSTSTSYDIDDFTGLEQVTGIVPLLVLLGFVVAGAVTGFMGIKMVKGEKAGKLNSGSLMLLGIGIIFIAVALIIFPVVLDGVAQALCSALGSSYTGLEAILSVTPLIVLVAFLAGGIVAGFFGVKMQSSAD